MCCGGLHAMCFRYCSFAGLMLPKSIYGPFSQPHILCMSAPLLQTTFLLGTDGGNSQHFTAITAKDHRRAAC